MAMTKIVNQDLLFLTFALFASTSMLTGSSAQEPDGEILGSRARSPLPAYASLDVYGRDYFPRAVYEEARTQTQFDILKSPLPAMGCTCRDC